VVASGGALGGFGGNPALKRALLRAEGIPLSGYRIRQFELVRWEGQKSKGSPLTFALGPLP
jgi:hypothetical protein